MATPQSAPEGGLHAGWRVPRPLLEGRIAEALERGTLLLTAGAGYGKTTALEDALSGRAGGVAWVRCAAADGDPGRLLELIVEALQRAAPGVADALGDRLAAGVQPVDVELAGRALGDELERLLVDPLTIVFDDAESIAGAPEALAVVEHLLLPRSASLRVAVASRQPLPLGTATLRATGRLTELGAADLAFSPDETSQVVTRVRTDAAEGIRADDVWAATEGWPIAVVLASLAPGGRPPVGGEPASLGAFLNELLGNLPSGVVTDLVESSVPADLDPALLEALGLPVTLVDDVVRLGLPLQRTEGDGWAYHPVVRDFLRSRLDGDSDEERRHELNRRCAQALEDAGRGPEAVEHWLAGAAPEEASAAVLAHGAGLARTAPATVSGWLERLPDDARGAPALALLEGRLETGAGRLDAAIAPLTRAVEDFAAAGEEDAAWVARLALADVLAISEDFESVIPLADGFGTVAVPAAPAVAVTSAAGLAGARRYAEASELFEAIGSHPLGEPLDPLVRGFHGFWVDLQCGRLDAALEGLRQACEHLEREDPFDRLPFLLGMQAVVLEERGEDAEALKVFASARRVADQALLSGYIGDIGRRFAAGVHARAGRPVEAEAELAGTVGPGLGWYAGDAEITRAAIAVGRGAHAEALDAAARAIDVGALEPWRSRWRNSALLAPTLVAAGQADWAAELIDEAIALRPERASCARLLALRAWLRELDGDGEGAVTDLTRAWDEAGPEAHHLVRRELTRLEPLLWRAVEEGALTGEAVVSALASAVPAGAALASWTRHPAGAARREAAKALTVSGNPVAGTRLGELESDPDPDVATAARGLRTRLSRDPVPRVIQVLGGFGVRRGAYVLGEDDWAGRRPAAQRLVRFLLAHRGSAVTEDALFEAFWPGREAAAARRSLQVTVSSARAALDADGAEHSVVGVSDRTYRLELSAHDVVDADDFSRTAALALEAEESERVGLLEAAAGRWRGEPLPEDRYEDWAVAWRERLIDFQRRVLGGLADVRFEAGDTAGAVEAARQWVELDPRDEAAHRRLMLGYARAGRRGHALRQYVVCRRELLDELGLEPGAETADLQRRILAGERL